MTSLRPMQQESFDAYRRVAARGYANDNVAAGRWPAEAAFDRALDDFDRSLPQGLRTADNYIYDIRDGPRANAVGVVWFAVIEKNGIRSAFVYDLEVAAEHRRRGHARAALELLEPIVRALGLPSIGLHVFRQNVGAQALYTSLGYEVASVNIQKHLPPQ